MTAELPPITAVERLRLDPGDIVAAHVEHGVTVEQAEELRRHLESIIPGHRVIVLSGTQLTVVGPGDDG
jgi:hypothetical protein